MLRWIIDNSIKPACNLLIGSIGLILLVAIPVGSMFGIAEIVDRYGDIYLLLFIPWFLVFASFTKIKD